jgi:hypothetical protein
MKEGFEFVFREQVVNPDRIVRAADPVDAPIPLNKSDRVPGEIVVDDRAAILEVLAFGKYVGADEDIDLRTQGDTLPAPNWREGCQDVAPLVGVIRLRWRRRYSESRMVAVGSA